MFRRLMLFCLVLTGVFAATSMKAQQAPASAAAAAPTAPPQAGPRGGGRGAPPVKSPEVRDGRVTFRLRAPNAKEVARVVGGKRLPMQKDDQGVWSVDHRRARARLLHVFAVVDGATITTRPIGRCRRRSAASSRCSWCRAPSRGCRRRRAARCHRPARVPFDHRERRPRLLRLHAARVRRTARAAVPRALSAARPR